MPNDARHRTYLPSTKDAALAGCVAQAYRTGPDANGDATATESRYLQTFSDSDLQGGGDKLSALSA